jgi:dolichol-phosphate mannosyltransferase
VGEAPGGLGEHLSQPEADLHLVVPVYNEAANFPHFYESIRTQVREPWRLLVVYDRDDDTTLPVARRIAAADPRVELLHNPSKGVLGALKTGLAQPKHGWVVVTMADGSDDHRQIDQMVELARSGADLVAPSRYTRGGAQYDAPLVKSTLSRLAGRTLHLLTGLSTSDPTNNFKLYSVDFLRSVDIESTGGFEVALELTVKAHLQRRRIEEIPTVWRERTAGASNFKLATWLPHYLRWYLHGFARFPGNRPASLLPAARSGLNPELTSPTEPRQPLHSSGQSGTRIRALLSLAVLLAPAVGCLMFIRANAVNVLYWDQWAFVPLLDLAARHDLSLQDFWVSHNEHRIVIPRLLMLTLAWLSHWDTRVEMYTGFALLLGTALLIWLFETRTLRMQPVEALRLLPTSLLLFSLHQWQNLLWGWQLQFFLCVFFAVLSLVLLAGAESWSRTIAANAFAAASTFSLASGFATWPAGLVVIWLSRNTGATNWRRASLWCLSAGCCIGAYLHGYSKPSYHPKLTNVFKAPAYFLTLIGGPLTSNVAQVSLVGGLALAIGLAVLALVLSRKVAGPAATLGAALSVFALVACALITTGRAGLGISSALSSRYVTLSSLFLIGTTLELSSDAVTSKLRRTLLPLWVVFISVGVLSTVPNSLSAGRITRDQRLHQREAVRCFRTSTDSALAESFPDPPSLRSLAVVLERLHLNALRVPCSSTVPPL